MSSPQPSRPLHKASSLILNVMPGASSRPVSGQVARGEAGDVIPDSEEERLGLAATHESKRPNKKALVIIEISSDEDSEARVPRRPMPYTPGRRNAQTPRARRIVQSSSSEASEDEADTLPATRTSRPAPPTSGKSKGRVIDLTLSSSEQEDDTPTKSSTRPIGKIENIQPDRSDLSEARPSSDILRPVLTPKTLEERRPLYADDSSEDDDDPMTANDGSILTLNEPRTVRTPIRKPNPSTSGVSATPGTSSSRLRNGPDPFGDDPSDSDHSTSRVAKRIPTATPRKADKAPRLTKKALEAAESARREKYARALFDELNRSVFKGGIPAETELKWNKRLLTTAGRAKWHKSRDGVQTTEIELAVKVLDCDERIRNTLSHEMCHLACWIINGDPKEGHGRIFRGWAAKVMRARPDIEVTTKHNYEITYKYEWKCQECDKIYGRHSRSIRPDECVCGSCKIGRLIPLFETQQRAPKTPKNKAGGQLAATNSRDSPLAAPSPIGIDISVSIQETTVRPHPRSNTRMPGAFATFESEDEEDEDVEVLARTLGVISISGAGAA